MADDPDPPRKHYQLKSAEFEKVNAPSGQAAAADALPTDVQAHFHAASATLSRGVLASSGSAAPRRKLNDVQAMLRENVEHANAAGLNDVAPVRKKRSRRTRDYWLVMVPVNAFLAWAAFNPNANTITFVYGIGGIGLFTAGFTWVMFGVIDDY